MFCDLNKRNTISQYIAVILFYYITYYVSVCIYIYMYIDRESLFLKPAGLSVSVLASGAYGTWHKQALSSKVRRVASTHCCCHGPGGQLWLFCDSRELAEYVQ